MKLALADRDTYYADPLKSVVPLELLLSREYAGMRRPLIDLQHASLTQRPGDPIYGRPAAANLAAKLPRAGHSAAGHHNLPGGRPRWKRRRRDPQRLGRSARRQHGNSTRQPVAELQHLARSPQLHRTRQAPRITLTPTLVLQDGKPVAAISVAGGDQQDQVTLQLLLGYVEFGRTAAEAVTAPRFVTNHLVGSFNQPPPSLGSLSIDPNAGDETIASLRRLGHRVTLAKPPLGHPVMLTIDPPPAENRRPVIPRQNGTRGRTDGIVVHRLKPALRAAAGLRGPRFTPRPAGQTPAQKQPEPFPALPLRWMSDRAARAIASRGRAARLDAALSARVRSRLSRGP